MLTVPLIVWPAQADRLDVAVGKALFERQWVSAPSSTKASDGLGPLFAARSCAACHPGARGGSTLVIRFGKGVEGDPVYGRQFQPFSVAGIPGEGAIGVMVAADKVGPVVERLAYGPLDPDTVIAIRRPPDLVGLGDIETLGDDAILANESASGVAGRARRLADGRIGRFGSKASAASFADQVASAFSQDMGLSSDLFPDPQGDCTAHQTECRSAPTGSTAGEPEMSGTIVEAISTYLASLSLPLRPMAAEGAALFEQFGCAACHTPRLVDAAGRSATVFSDLLLHEMGSDLDDGLAEPGVRSSEWRTAPLSGLGRRLATGGALLHDGRTLDLTQVIEAHGGSATAARAAYSSAQVEQQLALENYLRGL